MSQTYCCRLCTKICDAPLNLFDKNGQGNEAYVLTVKYFTAKLMTMEWGQHLKNICMECWSRLYEFNTFHETVMAAQRKLALSYNPAFNPKQLNSMRIDRTLGPANLTQSLDNYVTPSYRTHGNVNTRSNNLESHLEKSRMHVSEVGRNPSRAQSQSPQTNSSDLRISNVMSYLTPHGTPETSTSPHTFAVQENPAVELSRPVTTEGQWEERKMQAEDVIKLALGYKPASPTFNNKRFKSAALPQHVPEQPYQAHYTASYHDSENDNSRFIIQEPQTKESQSNKPSVIILKPERSEQLPRNSHGLMDLTAFSPTKHSHSGVVKLEKQTNPLELAQTSIPVQRDSVIYPDFNKGKVFAMKSELPENSFIELEEYDEPVGTFAGGEFGHTSSENSQPIPPLNSIETREENSSQWSNNANGNFNENPMKRKGQAEGNLQM